MKIGPPICLSIERESPSFVAGLDGLVSSGNYRLAVCDTKILGIRFACGHLQADAKRDVAAGLCRRPKDPGAHAGCHVSDTMDMVKTSRRVELISSCHQNWQTAGQSPAMA